MMNGNNADYYNYRFNSNRQYSTGCNYYLEILVMNDSKIWKQI